MDTLSSPSLSTTFKLPKSHHLHHHLKPHFYPHPLPQPQTPSTLSTKTTFTAPNTTRSIIPPPLTTTSSSQPPTTPTPKQSHQNPSTGYAVALLDVARRRDALDSVRRDVRTLSRWLRNEEVKSAIGNPLVEERENGEMLREIVNRGGFHKYVSRLVSLLVGKGKLGILREVLEEFGRVCDELSPKMIGGGGGAAEQVVLVPPGVKLGIDQIWGVAGRIQRITGAMKVTVRQAC